MKFVSVARCADLPPGESRTYDVGGTSVAIFNAGGEVHACRNVCPHRGGPVGEGQFDGKIVTCPWHGWEFDVTTGINPRMPAAKLDKIPTRIEGENVQIEIAE